MTITTITTKEGEPSTATANEDEREATCTWAHFLEPIIHDAEGFDKDMRIKGMKKEIGPMKQQGVYTERNIDDLTPEEQQTIISSRWVHREKGDNVRSCIVAKGFTEHVNDADDIYESTPVFEVLRWLLAVTYSWSITTGDISTAFLHAAAAATAGVALHMYPPAEFYQATDRIVWKLNPALYGRRSDHLADILQHVLLLERLRTEPNVFRTPGDTNSTTGFLMDYVDDLFFLVPRATINKIYIQKDPATSPSSTNRRSRHRQNCHLLGPQHHQLRDAL